MNRPSLPPGYVDMAALVGERRVTRAMAERNRRRLIAPTLERPAAPGLLRLDASGVWLAVKLGELAAPIRTTGGLAWRLVDVYRYRRTFQ